MTKSVHYVLHCSSWNWNLNNSEQTQGFILCVFKLTKCQALSMWGVNMQLVACLCDWFDRQSGLSWRLCLLHLGPLSPAVLVLTFMRHVGGGLLDLTNERAELTAGSTAWHCHPEVARGNAALVWWLITLFTLVPLLWFFDAVLNCNAYRLSEKLHLNTAWKEHNKQTINLWCVLYTT